MQITFLGTSAGKPTKERNVSAITLTLDQENKWYLFDCGEGTQRQIQESKLSIGKLDTIFITHLHGDHIYGLPGLLASKKMDEALKPLTIYGPKGIQKFIECAIEVSTLKLGYQLHIIEYSHFDNYIFDKFKITIIPLIHTIESVAFYIQENAISNKLNEQKLRSIGLNPSPLYGQLKKGKMITYKGQQLEPKDYMLNPIPGRKIIIAGDNQQPEILHNYLPDLDLLIHECTYTQNVYDNLSKKVLHTTAKDLGLTAQKYNVHNVIATHISPRYHKQGKMTIQDIKEEIQLSYHGTIFIAEDFDTFYLSRDKLTKASM